MKKIIILLAVFVVLANASVDAQAFQHVYNHLNKICNIHLGRGDLPELNLWAQQIITGQIKMEEVVYGIVNSEEAQARKAAGETEAADTADTEISDETNGTAVASLPVGFRLMPPSPAYIHIVQQIKYQCLVHLGRVNVDEIPFWADQVLRGSMKLEDVIIGIQNSDEAKARAGQLTSSDSETDPVAGLGE
jgi:hypothetical protein